MVQDKQIVLVASRDPKQAAIRKNLLEQAGFQVLSALDFSAVEEGCSERRVAGVVIGWSVPADEKRRVWSTVRAVCGSNVPVLELLRGGKAELLPDRALFTQEWDDRAFAQTVRRIFNPN
jgi:DNA-binding response OmpR family regulator